MLIEGVLIKGIDQQSIVDARYTHFNDKNVITQETHSCRHLDRNFNLSSGTHFNYHSCLTLVAGNQQLQMTSN